MDRETQLKNWQEMTTTLLDRAILHNDGSTTFGRHDWCNILDEILDIDRDYEWVLKDLVGDG